MYEELMPYNQYLCFDFSYLFYTFVWHKYKHQINAKIMIDKSKELTASLILLNEKLHFEGKVIGNEPISIDYIPPFGDNSGYTSLELLLLSLSSCLGSAVLLFLRRMHKTISGFGIEASGLRNEVHPTGFKSITMVLTIKSKDTSHEDVEKVIKLAEETYCPVWAMLKGNVEIVTQCNILGEQA